MDDEEDLLQLIGERTSPFGDYIDTLANGALGRYKVISQGGAKGGESLYTHVLNGVSVLEVLRGLLELDDEEARCLFLAYTIHDLNKLPETAGGSRPSAYKDLASAGNASAELERLGADAFFPEWRDYLPDITGLCRLHQGHLAVDATGLDRRQRLRYRLGWQQVERLGCLMRAADVLDLSHELDEAKHKEAFLREVNTASPVRFRFVWHRLAENRGIFTNLIHRTVSDFLQQQMGIVPLLCYPEGTAYLTPVEQIPEWTPGHDARLARAVERALREVQGRSVEQFIKKAQNGYRVDSAALESGVTAGAVMGIIQEKIAGQLFGERFRDAEPARREQTVRRDLEEALPGLDAEQRALVGQALTEPQLLPDDEHLRLGELAQAYRNLLATHFAPQLKARKEDAWERVYRLLQLPEERWPIYGAINGFRRSYFMVRDLPPAITPSLQGLAAQIEVDLAELGVSEAAEDESFVGAYLRLALSFSFAPPQREDFSGALKRYCEDQHEQCCYCGSPWPTMEWMAANVPPNVGVQAFSNRLIGGGGEPKRRVCPLCRTQFILEKLGWATHDDKRGDKRGTFYLHLFPYSFFTEPFLDAWRREVERLLTQDVSATLLDIRRWFQGVRQEHVPPVHFTSTKINGLALPRLAAAMSNTPVMALNMPGESYSEQFLLALQHAVIVARFFGSRLILSRTAVPLLPADAFGAMFVDGVPTALDWLVGGSGAAPGNIEGTGVERLLRRLAALQGLHQELWHRDRNRNLVLEFARAMNDNPLAVFFVADRAIEEKSGEPSPALRLVARCAPLTDELLEVPMTEIETLAQLAVDDNILGGRGPFGQRPRNALLKPFDIIFELVQQHPVMNRDDVQAAAAEEVFLHLQRIAEEGYKPGSTKESKIAAYVRQFFEGVIGSMYGNDVNRFIADERFVRSAYLWYVRRALLARREERAREQEPIGATS